jgi:lipopolysaccharide transport system permease protein
LVATASVVDNRDLIRQPHFPIAMLPVVTVTTHLTHFLMALPVLFLLLAASGYRVTAAILALPLVIGMQFTLTVGLGYLLATFHVTFRDTQYLLGIVLLLLFYMTPTFYDASLVPERFRWLYDLNPLATLLDAYRAILLGGELPEAWRLLVLGALAAGLLGMGYVVFKRASWHFVEEL